MRMRVHAAIDKMLGTEATQATHITGRRVHLKLMMVLLAPTSFLGYTSVLHVRATILINHGVRVVCTASWGSSSAGFGRVHDHITSSGLLDYCVDGFATSVVSQSCHIS